MIPGVRYTFRNGEELIIPPLCLEDLELNQDRIENFKPGISKESVALVCDVLFAALKENYPDMTMQRVKRDLIDVSNMNDALQAAFDVSGLRRKMQESESGEPKPAQKKGK